MSQDDYPSGAVVGFIVAGLCGLLMGAAIASIVWWFV